MSTLKNGNGLATEAVHEAAAPVSSVNGSDGPPPLAPPSKGGERDRSGRFAKGNKGGPGNPFNRRVAELRREMLDAVTAQDLRDIIVQLIIKAKMGDLAAAKLVLSYVLGKPTETVHPDRLDLEEWQLNVERPTHEDVEATTMGRCPADVANAVALGMSVARRLEVRDLLNGGKRSETPAEELRRWSDPVDNGRAGCRSDRNASAARVSGSPRKRR